MHQLRVFPASREYIGGNAVLFHIEWSLYSSIFTSFSSLLSHTAMQQVLCASIRETTEKLYQTIHKIPYPRGSKLQAGWNISSIRFYIHPYFCAFSTSDVTQVLLYVCVRLYPRIPCSLRTLVDVYCGMQLEPCSVLIQGT
jgi:hypothetical protein